ncbi:MAG: thioredoxin domain-containing protein [Bacteroidetes bacterium]|jgi:uncharacterized protein YyaL (SSP411 family)|nr:thioredoxin domain-containing protein [Bacteroidota bacterium]
MKNQTSNHLIHENSPYLLQHAYNPVEWFPWGDEALQKAKNEDKPILVSIGYAACHWCHVMEHESFEDEQTAKFMNTWFVNIKVDREERPDIDNIYMNACQLLTGAGGWPLNIFLTPDLLPFSGGTYFPPKPGYGKPSWMEVLMYMKDTFSRERDKVEQQAAALSEHILQMDNAFITPLKDISDNEIPFTEQDIISVITSLKNNFDIVDGGFGSAPKFPGTMSLQFLWRANFFLKDSAVENHIHLSLQKMMYGGIFDQIDGGFARYTVDKKWIIPHFEKMLYDNALLIHLYAEVFMSTQNKEYLQVVLRSLDFLEREMMNDEFGFYSSYDADSEGVEGKYYTFTYDEIKTMFGEDITFVSRLYNIEKTGNWEHTNILYRTIDNDALAKEFSLAKEEVEIKINLINKKLLHYRENRIKPGLDDKIILSWNALTCSAFVQAFKATAISKFKHLAIKNIDFLLSCFEDKSNAGQLFHTYKNGLAKHPAFIEDYAAIIQALLDIYEITSEEKYLVRAQLYATFVIENFMDNDGMFYFTHKDQNDIPLRNKDFYDNATPSGNSIMVHDLLRLSILTGELKWYDIAINMLLKLKPAILKHGSSFGNWLGAALKILFPYGEVAVVGKDALKIMEELQHIYYPHLIFQADESGNSEYPLLKNRYNTEGTFIHLCKNNVCKLPVSSVSDYRSALTEF